MSYQLHQGDCLETLRGMADNSVDSIVTDPPYGLAFMGKKWDYDVPKVEVWAECLRVLKPGGHLLAFAGTRTQHRMAVRIEDAGFEIRDMIAWVYGSGFPKSLDVSKAIDKAAGVDFDAIPASGVGFMNADGTGGYNTTKNQLIRSGESTEAAQQWQGWGTALKPALEPITVARKPLAQTVAANVLEWGTGALNIDGCRVGTESTPRKAPRNGNLTNSHMEIRPWMKRRIEAGEPLKSDFDGQQGRWPANMIHDGSDEVLAGFPVTTSGSIQPHHKRTTSKTKSTFGEREAPPEQTHGDTGSAARFFYTAKASSEDRDAGLHGFEPAKTNDGRAVDADNAYQRGATLRSNTHPTVKPTDLMRYLVRLVTPPGGTVLDPFNGSGSTGKACMLEGFNYIGCELDPAYIEISRARIEYAIALRASGADKLQPASERDAHTVDLFSGVEE